jgi:hypothetical protein
MGEFINSIKKSNTKEALMQADRCNYIQLCINSKAFLPQKNVQK